MYKNIDIEMARAGINQRQLAAIIGMSEPGLSLRLSGMSQFKLMEAIQIKKALKSKMDLEKLFAITP